MKFSEKKIFNKAQISYISNNYKFKLTTLFEKNGNYELDVNSNYLINIYNNFYLRNILQMKFNNINTPIYYGGSTTFRGVLENSFSVDYFHIMTNELIWDKNNTLFLFNDLAYDSYKNIKYSFGIGSDIKKGNNNLRIILGNYKEFSLKNMIMHIVFSKEF